jgi:dTDP-glucose 4,6-dehydratase
VIFHLAALIGIPYSYEAPASYLQTNISGTLNVLQAARELKVQRVVHTSTSEVYGTARRVPIDEGHPLQAQSPYSASKIAGDKIAEAFSLSFGVPVVTLRPFNTFGPRQSARAIIPTIITQCLAGGSLRLGNLHTTRDFNYVDDTVEAFILAAQSEPALGQTIHVGSGVEISVAQLAQKIAGIVGHPVSIEQEQQRMRPDQSEVERLVANNSLARTILEWQPRVSLDEGLHRTIDWMREHTHEYRTGSYVV